MAEDQVVIELTTMNRGNQGRARELSRQGITRALHISEENSDRFFAVSCSLTCLFLVGAAVFTMSDCFATGAEGFKDNERPGAGDIIIKSLIVSLYYGAALLTATLDLTLVGMAVKGAIDKCRPEADRTVADPAPHAAARQALLADSTAATDNPGCATIALGTTAWLAMNAYIAATLIIPFVAPQEDAPNSVCEYSTVSVNNTAFHLGILLTGAALVLTCAGGVIAGIGYGLWKGGKYCVDACRSGDDVAAADAAALRPQPV
jgi:hypothetical protein